MTGTLDHRTEYPAEHGKALFERLVGVWNGEVDLAETAGFIADDFVVHSGRTRPHLGLGDSERITTRQGLLDWISGVRTLLRDMHFTTSPGPIAEGDYVAGGYTVTGTYAGGAPRAMATPGTEIRYSGMAFVRLEDGMLVEYWVLSDGLELLTQLEALDVAAA